MTRTFFSFLIMCLSMAADNLQLPPELRGIGIEQKLGAIVPSGAGFLDEGGQSVTLGSYLGQRPLVFALVYYRCPMLCTQILSGVVSGLRPLSLVPGKDFDVVAISIDPEDTPETARLKRDEYARRYSRTANPRSWHFLTGSSESIKDVTEAVGFHYRFDPKTNMFVHASGIMILTPDGRVARYFYGVDYDPKDLKLGLIEASGNRIGSVADRVLLFCYHYDPASGRYGTAVMNLVRGAGIATLITMAIALTLLWRRDLNRSPIEEKADSP